MAITKEQEAARPTGTLGIERWVYFAYLATGLTAFWLLSEVGSGVWAILADSVDAVPQVNEAAVTAGSILIAAIATIIAFRHAKLNTFVTEVCVELSKVTWPNKAETWQQTRVVLIVSIIAAIILGVFDQIWLRITDLIYLGG